MFPSIFSGLRIFILNTPHGQMVKMGTMCLYGCQRISTVEFWDMSSFLLILTAFSWFLLEQLLGLAVMCALINSCHADALCARHSDGCKQFLGYFML